LEDPCWNASFPVTIKHPGGQDDSSKLYESARNPKFSGCIAKAGAVQAARFSQLAGIPPRLSFISKTQPIVFCPSDIVTRGTGPGWRGFQKGRQR
jgi:hypothetical protein